ncbi:hypothetical protein [Deinococcus sonorensis]|uniref:Antitoxin n=2 Tax=Deinococcus sonorensis TaxID=309891 RepID=A0AAU7U825_9DEIO
MSDDKSSAANLVDAAKAKVNEGADRLRAAGHEAASHNGDNPLENLVDKGKAMADNARAEGHHAEADHEAREADRKS